MNLIQRHASQKGGSFHGELSVVNKQNMAPNAFGYFNNTTTHRGEDRGQMTQRNFDSFTTPVGQQNPQHFLHFPHNNYHLASNSASPHNMFLSA